MAGYREIEHTADWELEVWAADLSGLLEQAALGMMSLTGVRLQPGERQSRRIDLTAADPETLLVNFLSELLYIAELEGVAFDQIEARATNTSVQAHLHGAPVASIDKEIKAVTYHNLSVQRSAEGLRVHIVFDV